MAPRGEDWAAAVEDWKTLKTDPGASYDRLVEIDATNIEPSVTWGTQSRHGHRNQRRHSGRQ